MSLRIEASHAFPNQPSVSFIQVAGSIVWTDFYPTLSYIETNLKHARHLIRTSSSPDVIVSRNMFLLN